MLGLLGPAFVASVSYVDPGNFATNFAGGAEHGYELAWVIVMASLMAIVVQCLTSKAGLWTGCSLPELCRQRFGRRANMLLWVQAEVIAMATDLARRALTMLPSLIILAFAVDTSQALVYSQIVLSFGIPFALIPLLLITRNRAIMTDMTNSRLTSALMFSITGIITGLNLCLLCDTITGLL